MKGTSIVEKIDESLNIKKLRKLILKTACNLWFEPCLDWAHSKYMNWTVTQYKSD